MKMICWNDELARHSSSNQNRPLTVTSMTSSGVSLQVAQWSTCVIPCIALLTTLRSTMLPCTTSNRGFGSNSRLWHSARMRRLWWSSDRRTRSMKWLPTLPVAPVTRMNLGTFELDCSMAWQSTSENRRDQRSRHLCNAFCLGWTTNTYLRIVIPKRNARGICCSAAKSRFLAGRAGSE